MRRLQLTERTRLQMEGLAGACGNRTHPAPCGAELVLKTSQATRPDPPPSLAGDNLAATRRRGEAGCLPLVCRNAYAQPSLCLLLRYEAAQLALEGVGARSLGNESFFSTLQLRR